jgi:hypothetical protein
MRFIPNAVTVKVARQALVLQKHSPTILFTAGVVGMVGTVVLASKATLKVDEVLDRHELKAEQADKALKHDNIDYDDADYHKDMVVLYTHTAVDLLKLYGPAIVVGGFSIAALTGSHHILSSRNTALTAAYAVLDKGYSEYRKRVQAALGTEAEAKLRYEHQIGEYVDEKGKLVEQTHVTKGAASIYARFFDEYSKNWQRNADYNRMFIVSQQNYLNDLLHARGHVFLNEAYDALGLDRSKEGAVVGWVLGNGDDYVDFGLYTCDTPAVQDFMTGREYSVLLDFNVDGVIYDKI